MRPLILILIAFTLLALRGPAEFLSDKKCAVTFEINNAGVPVTGTIEGVSGQINFDTKDMKRSRIAATAKPQTIRTGIGIRDKHLQREDYFNSNSFPEITITSNAFWKVGRNRFMGQFMLTIKGITREIRILFSVTHEEQAVVYSGQFEINRLDFALGEKSLILGDTVKVFVMVRVLPT